MLLRKSIILRMLPLFFIAGMTSCNEHYGPSKMESPCKMNQKKMMKKKSDDPFYWGKPASLEDERRRLARSTMAENGYNDPSADALKGLKRIEKDPKEPRRKGSDMGRCRTCHSAIYVNENEDGCRGCPPRERYNCRPCKGERKEIMKERRECRACPPRPPMATPKCRSCMSRNAKACGNCDPSGKSEYWLAPHGGR